MNRSLSSHVVVVTTAVATLVFANAVNAQTTRTSSVAPCHEEGVPGTPTLKRRQSTPARPRGNESTQAQSITEEQPCTSSSKTTGSTSGQASATARFEGLHAFSESEVLKLFQEKRVDLTQGRLGDRAALENAVAAFKELFWSHGYQQVIIETRVDERLGSITFLVGEGPRSQIAEIVFEGNKIFSSPTLATTIRRYLNRYESSRNGYDAEIFDYCMHRLIQFVRGQGYLQAKVGEPDKKFTDRGLIITISVDEGVLYRIGEIKIEGATILSPAQARAILNLQPGDIADGEALSKWLFEDLKKAYGEKGYITYTAEVTPEFKQDARGAGVVDLKVNIDEGSPFKVRKIDFKGEDGLSRDELRNLMLISEGNLFNQSLFEESIRKLNQTGLFQSIDKDKDVDFISDPEGGLVDLVIKLSRKITN